VGGCVVTSAEEFPEEPVVPPVVIDTPDLPNGAIVAYNMNNDNELRLGITVRDENVTTDLEIQARLSVVGQPTPELICPLMPQIKSTGVPQRETFQLVVLRSQIRPGACTKVEFVVSPKFLRSCLDKPQFFGEPDRPDDVGRATYWIWEMSGNPAANPAAAQGIVTSCALLTRAPSTSMPTSQ
jgi:hypothetical protein